MVGLKDVFRSLNRNRVRYLLIGGLASVHHGVPRTSVDVDIAVAPTRRNVEHLLAAMRALGLEPEPETVEDILGTGGVTFTNERQLDALTDLPAASFAEVWRNRVSVSYGRLRVWVVSREDQVRLLRAAGRPKDVEDADLLDEP